MIFPATVAAVLLAPTLVLTLFLSAWRWWRKRPQKPLWRGALAAHLALFLLHLFVTFPLLLGWFGSRGFRTRPDERSYEGPRLAADGHWLVQTRATLRDGAPAGGSSDAVATETIAGADGLQLRAFRVAAPAEPPTAMALLVHGLFRSAMEVEAPAAMLRRLGCECWLLDQRNHGGSGRAPATFGLRESDDVVAAVRYMRAQPGRERTPVILFGVSLGTVAVALALPRLEGVAGAVLDAPVDDLLSTAHRMLSLERRDDRRSFFALVEPWRSLVLASVQLWSGFQFAAVRPAEALQGLSSDLPVLLVGGEHDDKVPAASVQALFDSLPMPASAKSLWLAPGCGHGDAFQLAAKDYERHVAAFVHRALRPRRRSRAGRCSSAQKR